MADRAEVTVRDAPERNRFEAVVGGEVAGFAAYRRDGDRYVMTHTEVDDAYEGQGVGSRLAAGALDQVRTAGAQVVPRCPFIRSYIERHDEYRDLVA